MDTNGTSWFPESLRRRHEASVLPITGGLVVAAIGTILAAFGIAAGPVVFAVGFLSVMVGILLVNTMLFAAGRVRRQEFADEGIYDRYSAVIYACYTPAALGSSMVAGIQRLAKRRPDTT